MSMFSRRNGYNASGLQLEYTSESLKNRIFSAFYKQEFDLYDTLDYANYTTGIEEMMIQMGVLYMCMV